MVNIIIIKTRLPVAPFHIDLDIIVPHNISRKHKILRRAFKC